MLRKANNALSCCVCAKLVRLSNDVEEYARINNIIDFTAYTVLYAVFNQF